MSKKVVSTTVYFNEKYSDKDKIVSEVHKSENEFIVEGLIFALELYVVNSTGIVRSKKNKLVRYLNKKQHDKYYKEIMKIAKEAYESLA